MYMILKKKEKKVYKYKWEKLHYSFGDNKNDRAAKIYLRKTWSNIFLTLTDLEDKVIICKTSGNSNISHSKRRKKIAMAIEKIMKLLYDETILLFNIRNITIILKMKVRSHLYTLIKRLKYYKINIVGIETKRRISHNGVRKKKVRRV